MLTELCAAPCAAPGAELVQLKDGPGRDLTVSRWHRLPQPRLHPGQCAGHEPRRAWQKTVQKMRDRFGAPITDAEAQEILDYLDASYSGRAP